MLVKGLGPIHSFSSTESKMNKDWEAKWAVKCKLTLINQWKAQLGRRSCSKENCCWTIRSWKQIFLVFFTWIRFLDSDIWQTFTLTPGMISQKYYLHGRCIVVESHNVNQDRQSEKTCEQTRHVRVRCYYFLHSTYCLDWTTATPS